MKDFIVNAVSPLLFPRLAPKGVLVGTVLMLLAACGGSGGSGSSDGDAVSISAESGQSEAVLSSASARSVDVASEQSSLAIGGGVSQTTITIDSTQSISLSWLPPAFTSDGEPLNPADISGYEIYYFSTGSGDVDGEIIYVDLGTSTQVTVENLAPGSYQFSVAAIQSS